MRCFSPAPPRRAGFTLMETILVGTLLTGLAFA
jgi:hypothetical protein